MRQWQLAVACTLGAVLLAWQLHGLAIAARPRANPQASAWRPRGDGVVEVARDTPDAVATTLTPTQSSQSRFSASTMLPPAAKGGTVGGPIASPALPLPGSEPQQYVARDVLLSDAAGTHVIVQCPIRKVFRNASDNHPLTLLYSFEGSGNTFFRFMLENVTGVYTGAVYTDPTLWRMGLHGEGISDRRVVAVKSHRTRCPAFGGSKSTIYAYNKVIHLVRNPFDAFVAERKRRLTGNHRATPPWTVFVHGTEKRASEFRDNPLSWDQWLTEYAVPLWSSTMRMAFRFEEQSFLETRTVRFEDIRDDPRRALAPVLRLVGESEAQAYCLEQSPATAKRKITAGKAAVEAVPVPYPDCVYTRAQLESLLSVMDAALARLGYSVPRACATVLSGTTRGGTDAAPPDQ